MHVVHAVQMLHSAHIVVGLVGELHGDAGAVEDAQRVAYGRSMRTHGDALPPEGRSGQEGVDEAVRQARHCFDRVRVRFPPLHHRASLVPFMILKSDLFKRIAGR